MSLYSDFYVTVDGSPGPYVVSARGQGEIQVSPVPFVFHETANSNGFYGLLEKQRKQEKQPKQPKKKGGKRNRT